MDWTPLPFKKEYYETVEDVQQILEKNQNRFAPHTFLFKKSVEHLPIIILLGDAGEYNPYHLFFYMIARFRFLDDGKTPIAYFYENKRNTYLSESALQLLPPRFQRTQELYENVQYVELPYLHWYDEFIDEPWICSYIRELYRPIWENIPRIPKKYTYISREKSSSRKVKDEEKLFPTLKEIGFSIYCMEDLTFEEQIRLFHSSEILCGVHSGAFAFLTFCEPGTKVLELFWDPEKNIHYFDVSLKCKLQFTRYCSLKICNEETHEIELDDPSHFLQELKKITQ